MEFEVNKLLSPYIYNDILSVAKSCDLSRFDGKTVLITGAYSPLGYYLACAMLINNDLSGARTKIIAVDDTDKIFERYGKLTYRGDIDFVVSRDYSYLGGENADFVIHAQHLGSENAYRAGSNLLKFIDNNRASAVICSPGEVYGEVFNGCDTISENDAFGYIDCQLPENADIQASRTLIAMAKKLCQDRGLNIKFPIISDVYSAMGGRFIDIFRNAVNRKSTVIERGEQLRGAIYVTDAAAAVIKILCGGKSGEIYNVASGYGFTPESLCELLGKLYGDNTKFTYKGKESVLSPMSANLLLLNCDKLKTLGFSAKVDARSGAAATLNILSEKGGEA